MIALQDGRIAHDGDPRAFLEWAARAEPELQTPGAKLFALAGLRPPPIGVKQARAALRRDGLLPDEPAAGEPPTARDAPRKPSRRALRKRPDPALDLRRVWHEIPRGPAILRGVDLRVEPGESVALMGRNGAGKSTLLRHAAGLLEPTRGRVASGGRVALLLQNPGDYFLHDRVAASSPRARSTVPACASSPIATPATSPAASASASRSRSSPTARTTPPCSPSTSPRAAWTATPRPRSPPTSTPAPSAARP